MTGARVGVLLLLSLGGCAGGGLSAGSGSPSTTRLETAGGDFDVTATSSARVTAQTVAAPADRVWAALPAAFQAVGLEAGVVSASNRVYGTPLLRFRGRLAGERASRLLNCGSNPIGSPAADLYDVEATVRAAVQPDAAGGTRLEVLVEAVAAPPAGGTRTPCTSTRVLEERIVSQVRGAVGGA